MPRPDPKQPGPGQSELFPADEQLGKSRAGQVLRGRHGRAFDAALTAAHAQQVISDIDGAAASALRAAAWSLDVFEQQNKPYGSAKLLPAITETLRELHMTPESRHTDTDTALADLLAEMSHLDDDAPVSDQP